MARYWRLACCVALLASLLGPSWSCGESFGQDRKDGSGNLLPKRALFRLGSTYLRLLDWPDAVAYSPDGKVLAAHGASSTTVVLWDMPSGKRLRELTVEPTSFGTLTFSPDGKYLAFAYPHQQPHAGHLRVWRVDTGKPLLHDTTDSKVNHAALTFAPDSQTLITVRSDHLIQTWDLAQGKEQKRQAGPGSGTVLAVGHLNAKNLTVLCRDGQQLIAWDVAGGEKLYACPGKENAWWRAAFSPDGKLLAVDGGDGLVSLRHAATGDEQRQLQGHKQGIYSLSFSADSQRVISGSWDATLRIWDVQQGKQLRILKTEGALPFAVFAPDGKTVASGGPNAPHRVCLWSVATGEEDPACRGHYSGVTAVAVAPDGKLLATAVWLRGDPTVRLWDLCTGQLLREIDAHPGGVSSLAFSPDGKMLATSAWLGGAVRLWNPATGARQAEIPGRGPGVVSAVFSPDGKRLLIGDAHGNTCGLRVWDLAGKKWLWEQQSAQTIVWTLALCPQGDVVARGSSDGMLELWSAVTGQPLSWKRPIKRAVWRLAFSPDSRLLLAALGDSTVVWELATQQEIEQWPHAGCVAFSPEGHFVALGLWDGDIGIFDLATGKQCLKLEGGQADSLAFSPDGRLLVSGMSDTTALVWDLADLATVAPLPKVATVDQAMLNQWWSDLLSADAAKAHRAGWRFSGAGPEAVTFLGNKLTAKKAADPEVDRLIADLDAKQYGVREAAQKKLIEKGRAAEHALRQYLEKGPSLEMTRRIEGILAQLEKLGPPEQLRMLRALAVIEQTPGPAALAALQTLAQGPPQAQLTKLAQQALQRRNKLTGNAR
jgi:WD40 repeat protein